MSGRRIAAIAAAAVGFALSALMWEGSALVRIFKVGEPPWIDFATLARADRPNQYLMCPKGFCSAAVDEFSPIYRASVPELTNAWQAAVLAERNLQELRRDVSGLQVDYVQRSLVFRFPDLITVRFIEIDKSRATLAIYSRSIYGESDLGVNRARVRAWIAKLNRSLKLD